MQNEPPPLTAYSEEQRQTAMTKYKVIAPYLRSEKTLTVITEETGIAKRTLQYWIRDNEETQLIFSCEGSWVLKLDVQNNT